MRDFSKVTACGECCTACAKKQDGRCPGCIEAEGRVPEWADSGQCKIYACTREHQVPFCALCEEFPCEALPSLVFWNKDVIQVMKRLKDEYYEVNQE